MCSSCDALYADCSCLSRVHASVSESVLYEVVCCPRRRVGVSSASADAGQLMAWRPTKKGGAVGSHGFGYDSQSSSYKSYHTTTHSTTCVLWSNAKRRVG